MPRTIRFHLDEHCPTALADGLRRYGIDVTTTPDAGLLGASDQDHVAFGLAQGRAIFTQDADFLRLAASGLAHPRRCVLRAGKPFLGPRVPDAGIDLGTLGTRRNAESG